MDGRMAEKRQGYKKTELGWLPEDWELRPLLESCLKITDGSHFSPIPQKEGYLIATVKDMANHDFNYERCTRITEKDYNDLKRNGCAPEIDDVLFSKDGTIGKSFVYNNFQKIVVLSSIAIIKTRKKDLSPYYLIQVLKSNFFNTQLEGLKSGSALKRLILKSINKIKIPLPPLSEQQKIAAILSTVDEKIDAIDTEINAIEKLKKALMRQLLTRGIGHTEFKETKIGKIPKDWEVVQISDVIVNLKSGLSRKLSIQDIGIPVIRSNNIGKNGIDFSELKYWYKNDPQGANITDYILKENDVLINFINSISQIGKSCKFLNKINRDVIFTTNVLRATLNESVNIDYFLFNTKTERYKLFIQSITKPAVNQASFTTKDFRVFLIPLPPLPEQKKIASILNIVDEKLDILREKKETYQTLKKGMMQQLLTGALRMTNVHLNVEMGD